uniref:E3 ubiquitin-protein ligase TRIM71-like n=1 Tax=Saccoglossus kowalevskii TaxID=10224 RepID=A0ABM0MXP6_SACKO|nr:PREDICTED: E3 ubiquitin-protein ligase TRIM71-like [Saccoglossus kowalevskii]
MVAMETKAPLRYDIIEFQPGSDLAAHALIGVIKSDACPSRCTVDNIPKQLMKEIPEESKSFPVKIRTRCPDASWENKDARDNYDGTYHVMIDVKGEEKQQVAMTIGNQNIPGSPFHIPVIRGLVQTVGITGSKGDVLNLTGLTTNKHSDFVTADSWNDRVTIHDRDGIYKQSITFTDQFAEPFSPCDVAISDDNEYFMTDKNNKQVVVSDEYGKLIRKFGSSEIKAPCGIAINPVNKNVYVSEYNVNCIRKYTQAGVYIKSFGRSGEKQGEFIRPYLLAINSKGVLYVPDWNNNRIQVFNSYDQFMFEFSYTDDGIISRPKAVAIDKNDYVYVSSNHRVTKYDSYGQFICRIDSDMDSLNYPYGITVCNDGKIAVVDNANKCIKVFVE